MEKDRKAWQFTELEILRELNESRKNIIKDKQHIELLKGNVSSEFQRVKDFEKRLSELKAKKK